MKMKMQESQELQDPPKPQLQVGRTRIHNVRFYNLSPRSILCLAYNKLYHKLALSREDGSIEIWDMQHAPCLEKTIPKSPGNSVEGIAWSGEHRLFTAGLNGELVEWDLQTLRPRRTQNATGNSIWCLDLNAANTELAIGTEEGFINIFTISDDQMVYNNLFDKQEGRVLCCKFDASGEFLVTGSIGAIRIWDVKSGHAIHKMSVSRADKRNNEVIVWSLQVLSDFTIVSGDSRGIITVWDGKSAAQIESHQVLAADVLTVAVNEDENLLICSGIEPIIRIYAKTKIKREDMVFTRYVKFLQRAVHDHDVKALICVGDRILSGGLDGYLGISSASKTTSEISKYGPFLQNPCVTVAPASKLLLLRYTNYLEIWRLGSTSGNQELQAIDEVPNKEQRKTLTLETMPEKLVQLKSKSDEPIVCATISSDGQWICYSTQDEIRLFKFAPAVADSCNTQLSRIKVLPEQFTAATHVQFSADSKRLFLVNGNMKQILIFSMLENGSSDLDFTECIEVAKYIKDTVHIFTVSQCGSYIVAAGTCRTIAVWSVFNGKHFKHLLNLPRYHASTTAIALHTKSPRLVAAFSDGKLFEYDLDEMCFTCSAKNNFVNNAAMYCVNSIVLDERNPEVFVLHNDSNLFVLEKCTAQAIEEETAANDETISVDSLVDVKKQKSLKKPKFVVTDDKVASLRLKLQKSYEHLINLSWLSSDELVAVGVNPYVLIEQLPGAFKQKKFGTA